jgi:hypothetical protein
MPTQAIDTPQALDAAIAMTAQSRRTALLRVARGQGIRLPEVLAGIVALLAVAEFFVEPKRAGYAALIACLSIVSIYVSRSARQMKAMCDLLEMDESR